MERIKKEFVNQIEIEKSKFITYVNRCFSEQEAKDYVLSIKKLHPNATHHCYAFCIGENHELQRSNDDGEPSGTAGMPILEALRLSGVHDVVCVVVRYFGGIKLGAGGLVRAYSSSASEAIKLAPHTTLLSMHKYQIAFSYDYIRPLDYLLEQKNAIITSKDYDVQVTYTFFSDDDSIPLAIQEMSSGSLQLIDLGIEILEKDL